MTTAHSMSTKEYITHFFQESQSKILLHGRITRLENGIGVDWTNSGFTIYADCEGDLRICAEGVNGAHSYIVVEVDGEPLSPEEILKYRIRIDIRREYTVRKGLKPGLHTLRLYKLNEAQTGLLNIYSLSLCGSIQPIENEEKPRIEFIGDSITCGLHNLWTGKNSDIPPDNADFEDGYHAYDGVVARQLEVNFHVLSISGWGAAGGYAQPWEDACILRAFDFTSYYRSTDNTAKWDFALWQPDLVVINLGTNDWYGSGGKMSPEDFRNGVLCLLQRVRTAYPNAHILWALGMLGIFEGQQDGILWAIEQQREKGDDRISFITLPKNDLGGGNHPDLMGHQESADILCTEIQKIWNR